MQNERIPLFSELFLSRPADTDTLHLKFEAPKKAILHSIPWFDNTIVSTFFNVNNFSLATIALHQPLCKILEHQN